MSFRGLSSVPTTPVRHLTIVCKSSSRVKSGIQRKVKKEWSGACRFVVKFNFPKLVCHLKALYESARAKQVNHDINISIFFKYLASTDQYTPVR